MTRPDGGASRVGFDRNGDLFLAAKAVPATQVDEPEGGVVTVLLDVDGEDRFSSTHPQRVPTRRLSSRLGRHSR